MADTLELTIVLPEISSVTDTDNALAMDSNSVISGYPFAVSHLEIVFALTDNLSASCCCVMFFPHSGKADKVTGATTGNFAALDGEGNLTDSGKKPADFVAAETGKRLMTDAEGEKLAGVSEGATKTAASSTNGNVNIDGKEVTVYTEPENVLHDEDVEDFSAEEIAALLAD